MTCHRIRCRSLRTQRHAAGAERGSMAVELVIAAPVLLLVVMLILGVGRVAYADNQITAAAADAARAAVLDLANPATAAADAAEESLGSRGVSCTTMTTSTSLRHAHPGGSIAVTVVCTVRLRDMALPGVPGQRRLTATARSPIERHRSRP
ncbi:MAG: hypothetical protein GEU83_19655 [Pseudonocardiaceae bacterium]|nr:hypothetical protein [Pseudonocardiaceae bacterium]